MNIKKPPSNTLDAKVAKIKMPDLGLGLGVNFFGGIGFSKKAQDFFHLNV